jgi:hypothetical protein
MTDFAAMARAEWSALYSEIEGLTGDQRSTVTVCDPWTVRHLVARMTALGNQTAPVSCTSSVTVSGMHRRLRMEAISKKFGP